jgi:hypothetical protein
MRSTLILAVIAGLLVPGAALAFDANNAGPQNPDGSAGFSDPDEAPVIPGLQAYGIDNDSAGSSGVYIPQSRFPQHPRPMTNGRNVLASFGGLRLG